MPTIQERIDQASTGATVEVGLGEHVVNLQIDKALTLRGCGPATHLQGLLGSSPTLTVRAPGVALECFGIEHLDPDGVAVWAEPGTDPQVREVVVHAGRVAGVVNFSRTTTAGANAPSSGTTTSNSVSPRVALRVEGLLDAAAQRESVGDHEGAVELYDDVLTIEPSHDAATVLRALALRQRERVVKTPARSPSTASTKRAEMVVDAARGHSLAEAIEGAGAGSLIRVLPGTYRETLVLKRAIEVVGEGPPGSVVLETAGAACILSTAVGARVQGLTLRQMGGGEWYGVDIAAGSLSVVECDITSESLACVAVHGGATGNLISNRIHNSASDGVRVYDRGAGVFEENDIFANESTGITVMTGGALAVSRNRIYDGKSTGIFVRDNSCGVFEDNEIYGNALAGIEVAEGGKPTVRRNRIQDNEGSGIYVHDNGAGVFEDNVILMNHHVGVTIMNGTTPVFRRNVITRNEDVGVWAWWRGGGTFIGNDLRGNKLGAWDLSSDSRALVIRQENREA